MRARAELNEAYPAKQGERYNAFDRAIREIEQAYFKLEDTVESFKSNLLRLSNFSKDNIPDTAKTLAETDELLEKLNGSQFPKDTLKQEKADYAAKKAAFRKVRFTENGITLNVSEEILPDNANTYQYCLAVSKEEKNLSEYDKLVNLKGGKLKQVFTLKLMNLADKTDVTELLSGSTVTLRVEPEGFGKDLPLAGIFSEGAFSVSDAVTNPDGSLTVTLANGLGKLGLLTTNYVHPFLLYGLPIIGIVLLAAAVAVVLVLVLKKRAAQPDEKISELESKLEQQRQVNEIARKAKEEEERINREREEETARLRQEAIERVKEERRKALEEKERQLREQAEKEQSALAAAQLAEFERLAAERAAAAKEAEAPAKTSQKGGKKKASSKTGKTSEKKSAAKTATEKKPAKSTEKKSQKKQASAPTEADYKSAAVKEAASEQTDAKEQAAATKVQSATREEPETAEKKQTKKKSSKKK